MNSQGFCNSFDGTPIYYEDRGLKTGPAILLCYGLVCHTEHWRHQIKYFERNYRILLFDYRGHGKSQSPKNSNHWTLEACALDGVAVLRELEVPSVTVWGHSMGGAIALRIASLEPTRVTSAVTICGTIQNPFATMFGSSKMDYIRKSFSFLYSKNRALTKGLWKTFVKPSALSTFLTSRLGFNAERSDRVDVLAYMNAVNQVSVDCFAGLIFDYSNLKPQPWCGLVDCKTLIIGGSNDLITPVATQQSLFREIKNSNIILIDGASHNAHTDFPEQVNRILQDFLENPSL